jgi:predicted nucleic acid-binding protein
MELVDALRGKRICIDTAPFVYFIEKDPKYLNTVRPIFSEIDAGNIEALTSTITLLEVLVLPFKTKNESLAEKYRDILLHAEGLETYEIVHEVSETQRRKGSHAGKFPKTAEHSPPLQKGGQGGFPLPDKSSPSPLPFLPSLPGCENPPGPPLVKGGDILRLSSAAYRQVSEKQQNIPPL